MMKTLNVDHLHNAINKTNQNVARLQRKDKNYTNEWEIDRSFVDELVLH
ncbi:hypothetical protein [Heyndrickxia camelliae]|nr:hypothetical protein [Heyndrickxia camelliae]